MYVVYGRDNCPACVAAKQLLERKNLPFAFMDVTRQVIKEDLMAKLPGVATVPQIFYDEFYIGGFDQLSAKLSDEAVRITEGKVQLNG